MELYDYIDVTTRIRTFALKIPFDCKNQNVAIDVDDLENSYIITISELAFKKRCNEAIKQFLQWCDARGEQKIDEDFLFLKRFCDIKSDRVKSEVQRLSAYELEQKKQEQKEEWEERTRRYVQITDWTKVDITFQRNLPITRMISLALYKGKEFLLQNGKEMWCLESMPIYSMMSRIFNVEQNK